PSPPPPSISVMPEKPQYLIGDTVSILCAAPRADGRIQGFRVSGTSGWNVDVRTSKRNFTYTFNVTGPRDGGAHTCSYTLLLPSRLSVHSQDSLAIIISVRDPPAPPALSPMPLSGITVEGQPLAFLCVAPAGAAKRRFHFYREQLPVSGGIQESSGALGAQLLLESSSRNHSGNFSCSYEENTEGRWIPSEPSGAVRILVKEWASPPHLDVNPPSGVVGEGQQLRLTCAGSRDDFEMRFHFYWDGSEILPGDGGSAASTRGSVSELFFQQSPLGYSGNFSCGVEEEVGGAWVPSPRSREVEVTVRVQDGLLPLVVGCAVGGAVVLLGLLLAVWLCRRRRGEHWE
ncbi:FCRL5 protein, partial [Calyptomena viridis]|nr:FCRL5 protein [Calyptomena viridis]